MHIKNT